MPTRVVITAEMARYRDRSEVGLDELNSSFQSGLFFFAKNRICARINIVINSKLSLS